MWINHDSHEMLSSMNNKEICWMAMLRLLVVFKKWREYTGKKKHEKSDKTVKSRSRSEKVYGRVHGASWQIHVGVWSAPWVWLIVLGFNDTSTLVGHFVSSPRERERSDRRDSRRDEREGQGRKRKRNESDETEEIKTSPPYPYPLQG